MFTLNVLGGAVLSSPEGPITGRSAYKRRMALLAVLALARGRPVGRERLIGLLWPEHAGADARHTLSESLYVLRKDLGADLFTSVGDEVALSPGVLRSDVGEFEEALEGGRLEDAVAAYGGPLLDGFYVSDAPEFERWVDAERDRLARACADALERLASRAEEAGALLEAVEWWRKLAAHDPYSSRIALRLVQALDAAGDRPSALRAAAVHAARVHEELGVEPDSSLVTLVDELRAEAPRVVPRAVAARAEDEEPDASLVTPAPDAPLREAAPAVAPAPSRRPWKVPAFAGAALAAAALAAAVLRPDPPAAPEYDARRIAVLYFDDDSPRGDLDYLASGLTGELIEELSRVPALDVVSRNAVKAYRDGEVSLDSLLAGLRAGSIVEGSVQRSGDSVRVRVRLVDTETRSSLESRTLTRPMGDLFALERAVAEEVSGFLRRRLGKEVRLRQVSAEARSGEALDLVLRAEHVRDDASRLARRGNPLDAASALRLLARADTLLARAEAADPGWARPTVARGLVALSSHAISPAAEKRRFLEAATGHAGRVLAREPRNAAALSVRGRAGWRLAVEAVDTTGQARSLDAAERDLRRSLDADSTHAPGWSALSTLLRFRGRFAESDLAARRALDQDAYLDDAAEILQRFYFAAMAQGDYAGAREMCARAHTHFPPDNRFLECRLTLLREDPSLPPDPNRAWALLAELERLDPASRARDEGRAYSPLYRHAAVAAVLARAGAKDSARAVVARARAQAAAHEDLRIPFLYDEAYVRLLLGDRAGARRLLDEYLAARPSFRAYLARDVLFRDLFAPR
jgi:DNA-binding SARP family transcriptional activator/TolB-like protein